MRVADVADHRSMGMSGLAIGWLLCSVILILKKKLKLNHQTLIESNTWMTTEDFSVLGGHQIIPRTD